MESAWLCLGQRHGSVSAVVAVQLAMTVQHVLDVSKPGAVAVLMSCWRC
jgi:hypothetical protein